MFEEYTIKNKTKPVKRTKLSYANALIALPDADDLDSTNADSSYEENSDSDCSDSDSDEDDYDSQNAEEEQISYGQIVLTEQQQAFNKLFATPVPKVSSLARARKPIKSNVGKSGMKRKRKLKRTKHLESHIKKRLGQFSCESFAVEGGRFFCLCCSTEVDPKKKSIVVQHILGNKNVIKVGELSQHKKNLRVWEEKNNRGDALAEYIIAAVQG